MEVNWLTIKTDYINGGGSYRKLAAKYKVSESTLTRRAIAEGWKSERDAQGSKIEARIKQKTAEIISDAHVESLAKISSETDDVIWLLERAIRKIKDRESVEETLYLDELEQISKILKYTKEIQMDIMSRTTKNCADGDVGVKIIFDVGDKNI